MGKLILYTLITSIFFISEGHTETYLSNYFDPTPQEALQEEGFQIDESLQEKYQLVAKQFAMEGVVHTNIVTYETLSTGVHAHIGWYADGYIATALDGNESGKQVIIIDNNVVGVSWDVKFHKGYFTHKYPGVKVTSYSNKQTVKT